MHLKICEVSACVMVEREVIKYVNCRYECYLHFTLFSCDVGSLSCMQILWLFIIVISLAVVSAIGNQIWMSHNHTRHWYLGIYGQHHFSFLTELVCIFTACTELSIDSFRCQLKAFLFAQYWKRHSSALETFCAFVLYKFITCITFTFILHLHLRL